MELSHSLSSWNSKGNTQQQCPFESKLADVTSVSEQSCTRAQAADVHQDGAVRAAAGHALPHRLAAVARVELLRVHAPLPHVQAAGRAPIPQQLILRTKKCMFNKRIPFCDDTRTRTALHWQICHWSCSCHKSLLWLEALCHTTRSKTILQLHAIPPGLAISSPTVRQSEVSSARRYCASLCRVYPPS